MTIIRPQPWTSQPQIVTGLDYSNPLIHGGSEIVMYAGARSIDIARNKALSLYGTATPTPTSRGIGYANAGAGDIGFNGGDYGGSLSVTLWAGYYYGSALSNKYLMGDYNGSIGIGLSPRHSNVSNRWGVFDGSIVEDGNETLVDGEYYVFVIVREIAGGSNLKVYRNGLLKLTTAAAPAYTANFAVGSIGANQSTLRTNCNTLLAGRIRYKAWSAEQVKSFTDNPWQIFNPRVT